jgi:hypothetical protein
LRRARALAVALLLSIGPLALVARASTEEFSTFDPQAREQDDESVLDHYLARFPRDWREEWERAPLALRTSQSCLTSGLWMTDTDLKLRSPLGRRAQFGLDVRQDQSDEVNYEYFDFSFRFPVRFGDATVMFRPMFEKSRQDFGITWSVGADTSAFQLALTLGLEDFFNNFWEFRQTRVGNNSEPYEKRPWEPAFRVATRQDRWRAELGGRYLTPSRKVHEPRDTHSPVDHASLWGTLGWASFEVEALGIEWEARGMNKQALGTDQPVATPTEDSHQYRREWSGEIAARRVITPWLTVSTRWLYQERAAVYGPPIGPGAFGAIDRLTTLETDLRIRPNLTARVGGLYDKISIGENGVVPQFSYGSRKESRAYIGLMARFGRVSLEGIEGLELDQEPYDVWFIHDKGMLKLQTTF